MITPRVSWRAISWRLMLPAVLATVGLSGCTTPEERKDIPTPEVKVVQAYGQTLDENATPQQVVYVLLRSIADDVHAAQAHQRQEQKAALRITYSLAAYPVIEKRLTEVLNIGRAQKRESLGEDRDQQLYDFVRQWAPIVAYYLPSFPSDLASAERQMRVVPRDQQGAHVYFQASHNPAAADPAAREAVIIDVELVKEPAGAVSYWRVARLGYVGRGLPLPATRIAPATRPTATATTP